MAITNSTSIPKPKAPLNEYNLFFLLERKRILDCKEEQDLVDYAEEELSTIIQEHKTRGRRQHRRVHGRISFRELARTIASRWKQLDMTQRGVFERRARIERVEYQARLQQWEAAVAQQTANESPRDTHIQYLQDAYAQVESEDPTSRLQQLQALQASIEAEMARTMLSQVSMELTFKQEGAGLSANRLGLVPQEPLVLHPPIAQEGSNLIDCEAPPSSWWWNPISSSDASQTMDGDLDLLQVIPEQELETIFD